LADYLFTLTMSFARERNGERRCAVAAKGVFIGTSSWKYPGWRASFTMKRNTSRAANSQKAVSTVIAWPSTPRSSKRCALMPRITKFPTIGISKHGVASSY